MMIERLRPILEWISGYVDDKTSQRHIELKSQQKGYRMPVDGFKRNPDFLDWIELKTGLLVCYGDGKHLWDQTLIAHR